MRMALCCVLLAGCYTPEEFDVDLDYAICDWATDCFGEPDTSVGSYDYCQDARTEPEPIETDCAFRHHRAKRCVERIEQMNCPVSKSIPTIPEACDLVWDCG